MQAAPPNAIWHHDGGRRWSLLDGYGTVRGGFDRPGWTLRDARAVVDGHPYALTGSGFFTRHLTVGRDGGGPVAAMRVSAWSWRGDLTLDGGPRLPVARTGLRRQFAVGQPARPAVVLSGGRGRVDLTVVPDLLAAVPGLLPLMLLLFLHHERSTSTGAAST